MTASSDPSQRDYLPNEFDCTDTGNALRLVRNVGTRIHWIPEWREWVAFDDTHWVRNADSPMMQMAKSTARRIYEEAAAEGLDTSVSDALSKWAKQSRNAQRLTAMINLAKDEPGVEISADRFDCNPWLLNCNNGTVDLRTGKLKKASRSDLITKSTGVIFDPQAECPEWEAFVRWTMQDDPDLVSFIQRAAGYSLTGDVSERVIFFLHGTGRNGKSTLLETIAWVMGDYATHTAATTFQQSRSSGGSTNPEVVQLKGARFVTSSEIEDGSKLAVSLVKNITGNEKISARPLYKEPIQFIPQFKAWIATNYKPTIPADDQAIWDRLRLIPFERRISAEEMDRDLASKLRGEAAGILAWAVRGVVEWQEHGLEVPTEVKVATNRYREEMDSFSDFVEWLRIAEEEYSILINYQPDPLRKAYNSWSKENNAPYLNQREFTKRMTEHHFRQGKAGGKRVWLPPHIPHQPVDYGALAASVETMD